MSNILASFHGRLAGLDSQNRLISVGGFRSGDDGSQFDLEGPNDVIFFDDFMGDTLNTFLWHNPTKGSDSGTADFAVSQDINGKARGTTGAGATTTMAVNGIVLDSGLTWKASQGGLVGQARVQLSAITGVNLFVGFTDQVSALEAPFTLSGGSLTSNASDAAGFLFDTNATAATWKLVGVAADVDAVVKEASQSTSILTSAPVAATYDTLRVTISAAGAAAFYLNGRLVGGTLTAGAVTPATALTFVVAAYSTAAASRNVDLDYVRVSANRV